MAEAIGLPHSEIPGSTLGYQLLWAYRRFPRLSSPSDAKASTTCSTQLDHIDLRSMVTPPRLSGEHGRPPKPENFRGASERASQISHALYLGARKL